MREIYKTYSLKGKKQMKTTTFSIALFVAAALILSSAIPALAIKANTTKLNEEAQIEFVSVGPIPQSKIKMPISFKSNNAQQAPIDDDCFTMYGFIAWSSNDRLIWIDTCDPGTLNDLGDSASAGPCSGGTFGCDGIWYLADQASGVLYGADIFSGDMWAIGGGGEECNGLAYDPTTNRMYGVWGIPTPGQDELYEVDPDTGEQEIIGKLGGSIYYTIGLSFDADGTLYGWDVATDDLFTIDTDTGVATVVAPLTLNLNFGQDGDFHRETDVLYLTAVTASYEFGLAKVDKTTGECEWVDDFPYGTQMTSSCFEQYCVPPEHDIGIRSIVSPSTGPAVDPMPMQVLVKNYGENDETFNAQMEVIKCEAGPLVLEEYFDGPEFPPEGWETDWWLSSNTNVAGGDAPEARCYRYTQYYEYDYYDNYIMSDYVDCTGLEKVNLKFLWASDLYLGQYVSVFVKFRRNSTSPWKDVTPWDNPIGSSQDPAEWELGCYGFGEPMGEEFQFKWEYIGYWSYFYYFWLDDVTLEACGGCAEYAELLEYVTLESQQETTLEFPGWTPSEWHNETSENTWEEYPIHAWIDLEGDENARNDDKWKLVDLWYPWMHDVSLKTIDSPHDPGDRWLPGQTFPVEATMFNAGQYPECCIPIEIMIGEQVVYGTPLEQYDWPGPGTYYPAQDDGWIDEHKSIAYYYGWWRTSSSNAGGEPYEAYLIYAYARPDYVFYAPAVDTTAWPSLSLKFLSYINHYSGQGLYALEAGYSYDAIHWYAAWHEEPGSSQGYVVDVPIEGGHETVYIGFWVKGDPWYMNYWYIDNVQLIATGLEEEFSDNACQGPDIVPGQEVTFQFDDWTPEHLATEETAELEYITQAYITMEGDKNPGNDLMQEKLLLKYWHDVGIDAVESPAGNPGKDILLWDNGEPNGQQGIAGTLYMGYNQLIINDFEIPENETWKINKANFRFFWLTGDVNTKTVRIFFYEETGDCEPAYDEYLILEAYEFEEYLTGDYYFGYPEVAVDCYFDDVILPSGTWWVGFQPEGITDSLGYMLSSDNIGCVYMAWMEYWGYAKWRPSTYWGLEADTSMKLYTQTGPPDINTYIQPGSELIEVLAKNYGTFPERDLMVDAEIWEFYSDWHFGSQIWEGEIGPFNIMTPLGGTYDLNFGSCTFPEEGPYGLYLELTDDDDDVLKNNKLKYGIAADDTPPESFAKLNPSEPDGLEDWYVNDLEIYIQASDPISTNVSSGVKEIRYQINGGTEQVIEGDSGTIVLTEDGKDINVAYWSVDNVGNAETKNTTITISMDQTAPALEFDYEQVSGGPITGAEIVCTMNATEPYEWMSGVNRVEFYLNDVLQEIVPGSGPVFQWSFKYHGVLNIYVTGLAFDNAGNSDFLVIEKFEITNMPRQHSSNNTPRGRPLPR